MIDCKFFNDQFVLPIYLWRSMKQAMKIFLSLVVTLLSVYEVRAQSVIDFQVNDYKDTIIYVGYHFGNQKYLLDTLAVENEKFILETEATEGVYFLYSPSFYFEFILESGEYRLETSIKNPFGELNIEGSEENELFKAFQVEMIGLQKEQRELLAELEQASGVDSITLQQQISSLGLKMTDYRQELIEENQVLFTSEFLSLMGGVVPPSYDDLSDSIRRVKQYHYIKEHYFDDIDLSNSSLLRTPLLHSKVMEYFDRVLIQSPDSINQGLDQLFDKIDSNEEMFRYWLVTMFKKYAESKVMGMDAVMIHLAKSYYLTGRADWITEEYRTQLNEEVAYLQHSLIGKQAPPIEGIVDTLMQPIYLDQIPAPYTLLFIYDPDCGHCKKSIKKLEEMDAELYELGIQIFALCTTTDVPRWKEFVADANPEWIHAIDPSGKSYFRVYYNVRSTPQVFLLDESKTILAKKLDIDQFIDLVRNREGI